MRLHTPQFVGLDLRSTQLAPHTVRPPPQAHEPLLQVCTAPQARLQTPQWSGSDLRSTQELPHAPRPPPQTQEPPTHAWPAPHTRAQDPQFWGSLAVSTHTAPHIRPDGQPQVPALHMSPGGQRVPQPPQCSTLVLTSTQNPTHSLWPTAHAQNPSTQDAPGAHVLAQAPQLIGSVRRSTQPPAHAARPRGQPPGGITTGPSLMVTPPSSVGNIGSPSPDELHAPARAKAATHHRRGKR